MRYLVVMSLLFHLASGCFQPAAADKIYRYVDERGVTHFTNVPTSNRYRVWWQDPRVDEIIKHYAAKFSLDPALVKAVIRVESDFNPRALSHKGAAGLMQLIPETASDLDVSNPFDPTQSIRGGSSYLRKMLNRFDGNLDLALAAYNAGPTTVQRYGGVPPYEETQRYIKKVRHYLNHYRRESGPNT